MIQYNRNIGINTKNPTASFHIVGTNSNASNISLFVQSSSQSIFIIKNNGRIGILTENPNYNLDVNGTSNFQNNMSFGSAGDIGGLVWGGSGLSIYSKTSHGFGIGSNNILNILYIATSGNVGIGTVSPTAKLHIVETTNGANALKITNYIGDYVLNNYNFNTPNSFLLKSAGYLLLSSNGNPVFLSSNDGATYMMTINTDGNVGIGTASPDQKLTVHGNIQLSSGGYIYGIGGAGGAYTRLDGNAYAEIGYSTTTYFRADGGTSHIVGGNIVFKNSTTTHLTLNSGVFTFNTLTGSQTDIAILSPAGVLSRTASSTFLSSNYFSQGGNSFGATAVLGSNDNYGLQFETNNTTALTIGTNGNVGIGITNPTWKLHMTGSILISNATPMEIGSDSTGGLIRTYGSNLRLADVGGIEYVRFDSANYRVGINTISPNSTLDVISTATSGVSNVAHFGSNILGTTASGKGSGITFGLNNASSYYSKIAVVYEASNPSYLQPALAFYTMYNTWQAGTEVERMRISSNGNVGIGTASPSYRLDVLSGAAISARFDGRVIGATAVNNNEFITLGQLASSASNYFSQNGNSFGATAVLGTNDNNALHLKTNNTTRIIIEAGGNISIGTTSTAKFTINGDIYSPFNTYIGSGQTYNSIWNRILLYNGSTGDMDITLHNSAWYIRNNANMTINGKLGIGGVTTPTASLHVQGDGLVTGTLWTGNLIVTGTTSTVNSNNLSVKDAIIELATGQNGSSPLLDSGFIINRGLGGSGSAANVGFIWKEDNDEFVLIGTGNTASVMSITISNYENLRLKGIYASTSIIYDNLNLPYLSGTQSDILIVSSTGSVGKTSINSLSNNYFIQNGNSFGATAVLGTNDNNNLQFKTNNTTVLTIGTNGYVGIGITVSASPLHVFGGVNMTGGWNKTTTLDAQYPVLSFKSNNTKWAGIGYDYSSAFRIFVNASTSDVTNTPAALSILNDGKVGIGTASPSHQLTVVGDIKTTNKLISDNGSFVGILEFGQIAIITSTFSSYGSLTFNLHNGSGYSDILKIQGNGSIGIGTITPHTASKLDVNGHIRVNGYIASATNQLVISNNFIGSWAAIAAAGINMGDWFTPTSYGQIRVGNYDFYVYRTNTTSLLTIINTTGNVGIGIDTPSYKLDVVSGTSISARFDGRVIGVTAVNNNEFITLGQLASSASNYFLQNGNSFGATAVLGTNDNQALQFETNGTTRISIGLTGATRFINNTDSNFTEINQRFISFSRNNGSSIGSYIDGTTDNQLKIYGRSGIYLIQGGMGYNQVELTESTTKVRNHGTTSNVIFANNSDASLLTLINDGRLHFGSSGLGNSPIIYTSPNEGSSIDPAARKLAFVAQDGNVGTNFSFILNNPTTLTTGTLNNIVTRASVTNTTGNSVINQFVVNPTLSLNGDYNGILRGFYYNPSVVGTATYTHRAIETTNGNIVFNGGSVSIGSSDMLSKLFVKSNTINATNSNIWLQNTNSTTLLKINDDGMLLFGASSSYFGILDRSVELNTNTFGQYGTNPTFFLYSTSGLTPTIQFGNGSRTFNITDNNQIKQLEIGRFGNTNIANFNYNSGTISYYSYGTISTNLTPNIDYNLTSVANNSSLTLSSVLITPTYIAGTFANINTVAHHINIATQSNISNIYFYKSDYANINAFSVFRTAGNNIFLRFGMSGASAYIGHNGTGDHFGLGGTNRTWHLQTQFIFNTAETTISSSRVQVVGDLHLRSTLTASGNAILIENANSTPILTVKNTNDILISNALLKSYVVNNIGTGLNTIATYSGIIYQGGFVNYHVSSLTNSRTGQMMISYNTASNILNYTEVTSVDIGDTSAVNVYATMSNTDINIVLSINSGTWNAKAFINAL